jgi:anhydro-N-acetylmuramic acid kinase
VAVAAERDNVVAVGLMSGTSMDGVDAALVRMNLDPLHPRVELAGFVSAPYPDELHEALADLASGRR